MGSSESSVEKDENEQGDWSFEEAMEHGRGLAFDEDDFSWCLAKRRSGVALADKATAMSFVVPGSGGGEGDKGLKWKRHKISLLSGEGTSFCCRIYFEMYRGKVKIHAGIMLENEEGFLVEIGEKGEERKRKRFKFLLCHNMPHGVFFEFTNDREWNWLNCAVIVRRRRTQEEVDGGVAEFAIPKTFLEPLRGKTRYPVKELCKQLDVDLRDPFEVAPKGKGRQLCLLVGKTMGVPWFNSTNCLRFCRRMLSYIQTETKEIDEQLMELWRKEGQHKEANWFPYMMTAAADLPKGRIAVEPTSEQEEGMEEQVEDLIVIPRGDDNVDVEAIEINMGQYVPSSQDRPYQNNNNNNNNC